MTAMDYENIKFIFVEGLRAGTKWICTEEDMQLYCKNKKLKSNETVFSCREKSCNALVYVSVDKSKVFSTIEMPTHDLLETGGFGNAPQ